MTTANKDGDRALPILASSIWCFKYASNIEYSRSHNEDTSFSMTNRGLNMKGHLWNIERNPHDEFKYVMLLNCLAFIRHDNTTEPQRRRIGIPINPTGTGHFKREYSGIVYAGTENTESPDDFHYSYGETFFHEKQTLLYRRRIRSIKANCRLIGTQKIFVESPHRRDKQLSWLICPKFCFEHPKAISTIFETYQVSVHRTDSNGTRWIEIHHSNKFSTEGEFFMSPGVIYLIGLQVKTPEQRCHRHGTYRSMFSLR
jgi:hypothetical protein